MAVVKSVSFRLVQQEFTNIYFFQRPAPWVPGGGAAIINEIVGKEKAWHSTDVTFKRASLWSAGGTKAENQMLDQLTLSGTGNGTPSTTMDRERAVLIRWPAGVDVKGRPVYLRKWYHICGNWQTVGFSNGHMQNTLPIDDTSRSTIASAANGLKVVGGTVDTWTICASNGRSVTGDAQCHKWLEHHQLGDMWR